MQPYAIILAAGLSQRMGQCKASLPWAGEHTLLSYQISQLSLVGFYVIVVVGSHNQDLVSKYARIIPSGLMPNRKGICQSSSQTEVNQSVQNALRIHWVVNLDARNGKVSSILTGLSYVPVDCSAILISAVDQPRSATVYSRLLHAHLSSQGSHSGLHPPKITAPTHSGSMGHPLVFASSSLPALKQIREETMGLRYLVHLWQSQTQRIEFHTNDVLLDLNTPEIYRASFLAKEGMTSESLDVQ